MTTVTTCSNPAEAMLLKSLLEANEIPVYVPEELTTQTAVDFAGAGLHIKVDDENVEAARQILRDAESGKAEEATDDKT